MRLHRLIYLIIGLALGIGVPIAAHAKSLVLTLYPHDELASVSDAQLRKDYVQPWLDEMRTFTEQSIEVVISRQVAGVTDIPYNTMTADETLDTFTQAVASPPTGHLQVLLAQHTYGANEQGDTLLGLVRWLGPSIPLPYAIASLSTYSSLGHEIGHMMGATHDAAEILYRPWPCETYVYPARVALRANCYRYSDGNRAIISQWLQRLQNIPHYD